MRPTRLGVVLLLLGTAPRAQAQLPAVAPAQEPAPPPPEPSPPPEPPPPEPPPDEAPSSESSAPEPSPPELPPESAPSPEVAPETAPSPEPPSTTREEPAVAAAESKPAAQPALPPFERANRALSLEGKLGFSWRPSDAGFDDETKLGSELGATLYLELTRELAAGLELERVSLGRGTAMNGLDSVSADYTVSSAMLGFRAYPRRGELLDVFVGVQVGLGIQGVSASGTIDSKSLRPAGVYTCSGSDTPALQIGGGIGARLMLAPRWGVTARVNGAGRRTSGELVDGCAWGLGTTTTVSGSLAFGYDFDLEP